jgi:16S rRNA processing protein RimM
LAPFGLKGELKVHPLTDNATRFRPRSHLHAGAQLVTVIKSREAQGFLYVTLKGFSDRTSVEKFRHIVLQVPEDDLPVLPEGEYYRFQLIGLPVSDTSGAALGVIEEVLETGANDVYRVRASDGRDILLAATGDVIVSIDLAARRVIADPPDWV